MTIMLDWSQALEAGTKVVGGKAWNLARLQCYGFDIPAGGVLTTEFYRQMMVQPDIAALTQAIAEIPAGVLNSEQALQQLKKLQQTLQTQALSQLLRDEIRLFLQQQNLADRPLAIRSSATVEDGQVASFAGMHDSFLNVCGEEKIAQAILACYASLWSVRAVSYRRKMNIKDTEIAAAVVISEFINAEVSGVAFSCDPLSGRTDVCLINANYGLGESVVAGITAPDQFYIHRYGEKVMSRQLGKKDIRTIASAYGGTQRTQVADLSKQACLTDRQLLQLNRLLSRVLHTLGNSEQHQDIEWVFDGERFCLVQARPVTALPAFTVAGLQGQPQVWSNGNFRDAIPMVLPPLSRDFVEVHINNILVKSVETIGYALPMGIPFAKYYQGRFYCNASLMQWVWHDAVGLEPKVTSQNMGGHQPVMVIDPSRHGVFWQKIQRLLRVVKFFKQLNRYKKRAPVIYAEVTGYVNGVMTTDLTALTDEALLDLCCQIDDKLTEYDTPFIILTCATGAIAMLIQLLERKFAGEALAIANALLAGEGKITSADHGYRLHEMAQLLEHDTEAKAWLYSDNFDVQGWQQLADSSVFKRAFQRFLDDYGHRAVYEIDISRPRWHEDPAYLLNIVKNAVGQPRLPDIKTRQKQQSAHAWQRVDAVFSSIMRKQIRAAVKRAAEGAASKEAAKSMYVKFLMPLRAVALESGRRLHARGVLNDARDIFYCVWPEVEAVFQGEWRGSELKQLVVERKARQHELEAQSAPDIIVDDQPSFVQAQQCGRSDGLLGIAVAPGQAQGAAFVALDPEQGVAMKSGRVLVAPSTDPAWTPLFLNAAALVMETGGYLSHGSIVAREYGIPAVVNIAGVCSVIKMSDVVKVDGDRGSVEVVS